MSRPPVQADFPENINLEIVHPPKRDLSTNVLLLLHGLGDRQESFARLGQNMNLPETTCISIQAPHGLLDLGGFHWGDDIIFDSNDGGLDSDAGFKSTSALLRLVVNEILIGKCNYKAREIMVFGFGQGGMAALNLAVAQNEATIDGSSKELGGIISIGAPLPRDAPAALDPKCKTPVLVCAGAEDSIVTSSAEDKLQRVFSSVDVHRYRKPGDHMPSNQEEMLPVMRFLASRLLSMKGIPRGSIEVNRN